MKSNAAGRAFHGARVVTPLVVLALCTTACDDESDTSSATPPMLPVDGSARHQGTGAVASGAISDAQLDRLAAAVAGVNRVQEKLQRDLSESPEQARALRAAASNESEKAVRATGMTMQQYQMLAKRVNEDPALKRRLRRRLAPEHP